MMTQHLWIQQSAPGWDDSCLFPRRFEVPTCIGRPPGCSSPSLPVSFRSSCVKPWLQRDDESVPACKQRQTSTIKNPKRVLYTQMSGVTGSSMLATANQKQLEATQMYRMAARAPSSPASWIYPAVISPQTRSISDKLRVFWFLTQQEVFPPDSLALLLKPPARNNSNGTFKNTSTNSGRVTAKQTAPLARRAATQSFMGNLIPPCWL